MNGLEVVEIQEEGFFGKLLGKKNPETAFREINNLIASGPIFQVYDTDIGNSLRKQGLDFDTGRSGLVEIYKKVLAHYAKNGELSKADAEKMERLAALFRFPPSLTSELDASVVKGASART